ncbi:hypothetical protein [Trinickia sp.]|uniref:hypothetical protein n=1 Tax=Trinickia sp. TaxID=2571163 RepID=UPI003F82331F
MEKWIVVGGIWTLAVVCLTLFVRGASPAHQRAVALARVRQARLRAEAAANDARMSEQRG